MDLLQILREPGSVLLDTSAESSRSSFLFRGPERVLSASRPRDVPGLLKLVDEALADGWYAAGYLGYECGYGFEPERFSSQVGIDYERELGYPLCWFGLYRKPQELKPEVVAKALGDISAKLDGVDLPLSESEAAYRSKIEQIRGLIRDGDVYQVNYTGRFQGAVTESALGLYGLMRKRQPVAYGAFIQLGSAQILSASPEQFIEWKGRQISARPMKGTAPRGSNPAVDSLLVDWLNTDTKSRAENLMIVDLLRNDLSIVCEPGSVQVPSLFDVESYRSVLQMTSSVSGRLKSDCVPSRLLSALFPCGSVTGAPKIRAMRRILELETLPRGIYCGAIGYMSPEGNGSFNVAIRTLSLKDNAATLGSGGGIVWDSEPKDEYLECLLKGQFLTSTAGEGVDPIEIIETMRWENGIDLLPHHLARLERTTAAMGYSYPVSEIVRGLDALNRELPMDEGFVVRLLLGPGGALRIQTKPVGPALSRPYRIGLARGRVTSLNPFAQLKTTFRSVYENGRTEAEQRGLDEIIYLNERDELTEGTITNVFLKLDGDWVTPPLSCGVLPGIARQIMLESSRSPAERVLSADDLLRAEKILLTNAVRGVLDAVLEANATALQNYPLTSTRQKM